MKKPKHGRQRPDQSNQTNVLLAVDRQNSVLAELNNSDLNKLRYSAYGQRSAERDPAASVAFNGQFREPDTGWYLLGNGYRAYNPVLRRFHSPDSLSPFGSGGLNAYAYCVGDPVNQTDPTGHYALGMLLRPGFLFGFGAATTVASALTFGAAFIVPEDKRTALMIAGGVGLAVGAGLMGVGGLRYRSMMRSKLAASRKQIQPSPVDIDKLETDWRIRVNESQQQNIRSNRRVNDLEAKVSRLNRELDTKNETLDKAQYWADVHEREIKTFDKWLSRSKAENNVLKEENLQLRKQLTALSNTGPEPSPTSSAAKLVRRGSSSV